MRLAPGSLLSLVLAAVPAVAAPPTLSGIAPHGMQRGRTVTFQLSGEAIGLAPLPGSGPEVRTTAPGSLGAIRVAGPNRIEVAVTVPGDAPVGSYSIQVRTADGLSGALPLAIGDLAEVAEEEPNDDRATAQALSLPVCAEGSCTGVDRDQFRFRGKRGETLVLEVEARRLGSGLDAALTILDASGRDLAAEAVALPTHGDPRLVFTVPADGDYVVVLHDIKYAAGGDPFYRLKIGRFACADAVFPLGWRRGAALEVEFQGGTLAAPCRARFLTPSDPALAWMTVNLPGPGPLGTAPLPLLLSDEVEQIEPEALGPHPLAIGTVLNGRISRPGEVDGYRVAVQPGQALGFEVIAARVGSRLDPVLAVSRPDGSVLAESDDSQGLDALLEFAVPAGLAELIVSVRDRIGRGGPAFGYRLRARPAIADFDLEVAAPTITIPRGASTLVPVRVVRRQFAGPIQLSIPAEQTGIQASGGLIAAGAEEGILVLAAARDAEVRALALEIWGEGGPPAQPIRRRARAAGGGTPAGPVRPFTVPAAVGTGPPATLAAAASSLTFLHGQTAELTIRASRAPGHTEPIEIATAGMPRGFVTGGTATIAGDRTEATLSFDVDAQTPLDPIRLILTGKLKVNGREETIALPPIPAEVRRPFALELVTPMLTLAAGSKASITGLVRRVAPFRGPVAIALEGSPPAHVRVSPTTVAPGAALAQIDVAADPEAAPATFDILVRAATDLEGRKNTKGYVIPDVPVRVTVTSARAAPVAAQ
jgi:hypothetical protein